MKRATHLPEHTVAPQSHRLGKSVSRGVLAVRPQSKGAVGDLHELSKNCVTDALLTKLRMHNDLGTRSIDHVRSIEVRVADD